MKKLITLYIVGAIFTNSYVRLYRVEQWTKEGMKTATTPRERDAVRTDSGLCLVFSSIFWPVYVAAKTADTILTVRVKVELPEILTKSTK